MLVPFKKFLLNSNGRDKNCSRKNLIPSQEMCLNKLWYSVNIFYSIVFQKSINSNKKILTIKLRKMCENLLSSAMLLQRELKKKKVIELIDGVRSIILL